MQEVIHSKTCVWYRETPEVDFGFSGRAAYAMGLDKPNYPVPAIVHVTIEADDYSARVTTWESTDAMAAAQWQSRNGEISVWKRDGRHSKY